MKQLYNLFKQVVNMTYSQLYTPRWGFHGIGHHPFLLTLMQ